MLPLSEETMMIIQATTIGSYHPMYMLVTITPTCTSGSFITCTMGLFITCTMELFITCANVSFILHTQWNDLTKCSVSHGVPLVPAASLCTPRAFRQIA